MRSVLSLSYLLLPLISLISKSTLALTETIHLDGVDIQVVLPGLALPLSEPSAHLGPRRLPGTAGQPHGAPVTVWIDGIEFAIPSKRDPVPSGSSRTEWINGADVIFPGKRQLPLAYPPLYKAPISDESRLSDRHYEPNAALQPRAPAPGRLFGDSGKPHWTDPRQNESITSCGLTSAMQALAYILPEVIANNLLVEDGATADQAGGSKSVLVGVTNWNVAPLVKSAVTVEKASLNSSNMMASDIWWPGAFEKAIEALGQPTTFILSSRAMTMVSGLDASFSLTTDAGPKAASTNKQDTWAVLLQCTQTPITLQTFRNATITGEGALQVNHVYTVLKAEEVAGVKTLTLHNPHGWDNVLSYDIAWPQIYLYSYLTSLPTRESFGLGELVQTPCTPIPQPSGVIPIIIQPTLTSSIASIEQPSPIVAIETGPIDQIATSLPVPLSESSAALPASIQSTAPISSSTHSDPIPINPKPTASNPPTTHSEPEMSIQTHPNSPAVTASPVVMATDLVADAHAITAGANPTQSPRTTARPESVVAVETRPDPPRSTNTRALIGAVTAKTTTRRPTPTPTRSALKMSIQTYPNPSRSSTPTRTVSRPKTVTTGKQEAGDLGTEARESHIAGGKAKAGGLDGEQEDKGVMDKDDDEPASDHGNGGNASRVKGNGKAVESKNSEEKKGMDYSKGKDDDEEEAERSGEKGFRDGDEDEEDEGDGDDDEDDEDDEEGSGNDDKGAGKDQANRKASVNKSEEEIEGSSRSKMSKAGKADVDAKDGGNMENEEEGNDGSGRNCGDGNEDDDDNAGDTEEDERARFEPGGEAKSERE